MTKSIFTNILLAVVGLFFFSCDSKSKVNKEATEQTEAINSKYSIASSEYEDLSTEALEHIESFNFSKLGEMVSDDIEYYLPDGGEADRTRFIGKEEFLNFWNTYQEKTGLNSWKVSNIVCVPINSHNKLKYSNIDGVFTITYFSLDFKFGEEETSVRANFGFHFNEDKKIDKLYTYYDRTPIIEAAKLNVLKNESK